MINNEKKEKGILNKKIKGKIKRSTIPKKQNNNYFNEPLNTSRTIQNRGSCQRLLPGLCSVP